jgi:hypothetical protein
MVRTCVALAVSLAVAHAAHAAGPFAACAFDATSDAGASGQGPRLNGGRDARRGWLTATYRDLTVVKTVTKADRSVDVAIRLGDDEVGVHLGSKADVRVSRGGRSVDVVSAESLATVQDLLAGSHAVFGIRALLSERERTSELDAPEMSLLSAAAFVASLVGDIDAPRRLASRFVERHRGIVQPVGYFRGCWSEYSTESTAAWNDLQSCMDEANESDSFFEGAYRRLACNAVWTLRSESAWFEYLECLSPLSIAG